MSLQWPLRFWNVCSDLSEYYVTNEEESQQVTIQCGMMLNFIAKLPSDLKFYYCNVLLYQKNGKWYALIKLIERSYPN